ncbi:SGNH/GDSL hydrolase family protein [Enterococcus sp. AZ109]|uniref:SGNH/GDSL hydrolase family protein n=1 Tax=Enterococcus sp. AZ109 TaxID=2774634 RepID=UPI003F27025D
MKKFITPIIPAVVAVLAFVFLSLLLPKAEPRLKVTANNPNEKYKQTVHFVALGDSLTQGVGDETNRGGFVPLVADSLKNEYSISTVQTENFGVSGERSDQILKRLSKDEDLQRSLESADMITLTVGGNDLLQAFQKNMTATSAKKFNSSIKKYQKNVEKILTETRKLNKDAPIYILGIYNPYYLNFPDIDEMQQVVDNWNDATEELTEDTRNSYFVPINDLLYKGLPESSNASSSGSSTQESSNGSSTRSSIKRSISESSEDSTTQTSEQISEGTTVRNNVLYDGDNFHPNNLGYQLMANAVKEEMMNTNDLWLLKEGK